MATRKDHPLKQYADAMKMPGANYHSDVFGPGSVGLVLDRVHAELSIVRAAHERWHPDFLGVVEEFGNVARGLTYDEGDPHRRSDALRRLLVETSYILGGGYMSPLGDEVLTECKRAIDKHGLYQTPASPYMTDAEKLIILAEELGELAAEFRMRATMPKLREEGVQVLAMAALWLATPERGQI